MPQHYYSYPYRENVFNHYAEIELSLRLINRFVPVRYDRFQQNCRDNGDCIGIKGPSLINNELFLTNYIEEGVGTMGGKETIHYNKWSLRLGGSNRERLWEGIASRYVWDYTPPAGFQENDLVTVRFLVPYNIEDNLKKEHCLDLFLDDKGKLVFCEPIPKDDFSGYRFELSNIKDCSGSDIHYKITRLLKRR